jgi:hypothetical protein
VSWAIKDKGYTQRRACGWSAWSRRPIRYVSKRPDDGACGSG